MALTGKTISINEISRQEQHQMLTLMQRHYRNVDEGNFTTDLSEKDWVILLRNEENKICGFSTQLLFEHRFRDEKLLILFSGDTVIDSAYWGSFALPIAWGNLMLSLKTANPGEKLYWMLISKGVRTYRFLPIFFHEFYPRHEKPTPEWEADLINSLGHKRYPDHYNAQSGLINGTTSSQALKAEFDLRGRSNPHVDFFYERNPHVETGSELVCIAPLGEDNITPFIKRQLKKHADDTPPLQLAE